MLCGLIPIETLRACLQVQYTLLSLTWCLGRDSCAKMQWSEDTVTMANQAVNVPLVWHSLHLWADRNEEGVRIEEAAAVGIAFAAAFLPHRHVIDRPFLMRVERPGLSLPLFVGYITEEDWKNPGNS